MVKKEMETRIVIYKEEAEFVGDYRQALIFESIL
jgi:hypothetical protein